MFAMAGGTETRGGPTRRRGEELEQAIYRAALSELRAVGYAGMTMEGIAGHAQTGKAALYRRWPSKKNLVLDAFVHALPSPQEVALPGSVRDDLLASLTVMSDVLAGRTAYPGLAVIADLFREAELREAFADKIIEPRLLLIRSILRDGIERGEINPGWISPLVTRTGPALVIQTFLLTGKPPPEPELAHIVDEIVMPLLR